jgi:class 3 adenylate cyclase
MTSNTRMGAAPIASPRVARLRSTERSCLSDRAFAYVDSQGNRRLPIHDASHVRNALARFGQVRFEDDAARERARARLLQAAKRYRIVPIGFIASELGNRLAAKGTLPSGFVTMLMTDVEGSTALVQQFGGRFGALIDDVWNALRAAVTEAAGIEVEARADEFFAVFEAPRAAVDAAIAIQRQLPERAFLDGARVRVRIGVHSGYPTMTAANYVGLDVNTTSRITALGHGGQIVVSANTREAVRSTSASGLRFVALGRHSLRGIPDPVALFQVASKGLATRFPALRV